MEWGKASDTLRDKPSEFRQKPKRGGRRSCAGERPPRRPTRPRTWPRSVSSEQSAAAAATSAADTCSGGGRQRTQRMRPHQRRRRPVADEASVGRSGRMVTEPV